jgi:hypothetical protein
MVISLCFVINVEQWHYRNILHKIYSIKYHIGLQHFSCQDHDDTVCVPGSYRQLTPTAMPVQQHKA